MHVWFETEFVWISGAGLSNSLVNIEWILQHFKEAFGLWLWVKLFFWNCGFKKLQKTWNTTWRLRCMVKKAIFFQKLCFQKSEYGPFCMTVSKIVFLQALLEKWSNEKDKTYFTNLLFRKSLKVDKKVNMDS